MAVVLTLTDWAPAGERVDTAKLTRTQGRRPMQHSSQQLYNPQPRRPGITCMSLQAPGIHQTPVKRGTSLPAQHMPFVLSSRRQHRIPDVFENLRIFTCIGKPQWSFVSHLVQTCINSRLYRVSTRRSHSAQFGRHPLPEAEHSCDWTTASMAGLQASAN